MSVSLNLTPALKVDGVWALSVAIDDEVLLRDSFELIGCSAMPIAQSESAKPGPDAWLIVVNAEQEATGANIESSHIMVPAKQIARTAPIYPSFELRKRRQAWVYIAYCIDESGSTQNVSVLDPVGSEEFDKAAIETVKQWKFVPDPPSQTARSG